MGIMTTKLGWWWTVVCGNSIAVVSKSVLQQEEFMVAYGILELRWPQYFLIFLNSRVSTRHMNGKYGETESFTNCSSLLQRSLIHPITEGRIMKAIKLSIFPKQKTSAAQTNSKYCQIKSMWPRVWHARMAETAFANLCWVRQNKGVSLNRWK